MSAIVLPKMKSSPDDEQDDFVDVMEGMKPGEMPMPDKEGVQEPSLIIRLLIKWL